MYNLKETRKSKKLTQVDLAKMTGLSGGYISQIESGITAPTKNTAKKINKALGLPEDEEIYIPKGMRPEIKLYNTSLLRLFRQNHNLTEKELANDIGINCSCISMIECNKRPLKETMVDKICSTYGCSKIWFDTGGENENSKRPPVNYTEIMERVTRVRGTLSSKKFAEKIGYSPSQVSAIYQGKIKPTKRFLKKISKACNVDILWLLYG